MVLLIAWVIVVLSFFILAVQLFITILEFKLTTLAGFVLVPFALWNKTAFLAERVLGNVVASGIKLMVLAVIVGIGTTFFHAFIQALPGHEPSLKDAMTLVLASLSLFGLGIFGPGIATGLVAGAPQLGAGAVIGTAAALAGGTMLAGAGARALGGGGLAAIRAGSAVGSGASTAYRLGQATSGETGLAGVGAGLGRCRARSRWCGPAGYGLVRRLPVQRATDGPVPRPHGVQPAAPWRLGAGNPGSGFGDSAPAWARQLHRAQRRRGHVQMATQAIKDGDRPGHGISPSIREES